MIRVATVGVGGVARLYRKSWANLPGVQWALAVDLSDKELAECRELGVQRTSNDFADALAGDIDVVEINTPNHLHEEQAIAALRSGKHVLLQKPMANTLAAADAIVQAARVAKGALGMYMSSYTDPLVWQVKQIIERGALGAIQSIRARDAHRGGLKAKADENFWRNSLEKTGGGSFTQLSVHAINLVQWWLGMPIIEVAAYSANYYCPNIGGDDVTTAIAQFQPTAGGASEKPIYGIFDSGYASEGSCREIYGMRGTLRIGRGEGLELTLDAPYESELIHYTTPGKPMNFTLPTPRRDDTSNPFNQQRMFIDRIVAGKPPHMSGEAGRRDLAVVMACYTAAKSGRREPVAEVARASCL